MGKGYYFTLSVEIPKDTTAQKAKEYYTSEAYIRGLEAEYGCEVVFTKIINERAEYKVYLNEKREEAKVVNGEG